MADHKTYDRINSELYSVINCIYDNSKSISETEYLQLCSSLKNIFDNVKYLREIRVPPFQICSMCSTHPRERFQSVLKLSQILDIMFYIILICIGVVIDRTLNKKF